MFVCYCFSSWLLFFTGTRGQISSAHPHSFVRFPFPLRSLASNCLQRKARFSFEVPLLLLLLLLLLSKRKSRLALASWVSPRPFYSIRRSGNRPVYTIPTTVTHSQHLNADPRPALFESISHRILNRLIPFFSIPHSSTTASFSLSLSLSEYADQVQRQNVVLSCPNYPSQAPEKGREARSGDCKASPYRCPCVFPTC